MVEFHLDKGDGVLQARVSGPLKTQDFDSLAAEIDPFIEANGTLVGVILEIGQFLGWEDLGAVARHFRFVRDHHHQIRRVAVVTDSMVVEAAEQIAAHFVSAEVRHFPLGEGVAARRWILA